MTIEMMLGINMNAYV